MNYGLEGRVAVVTGAGSGMGLATSEAFAREQVKVVVADLNEESGKEAVEKITTAGGTAIFQKADVSSRSDCHQLIDQTLSHFGRIDILVNNAGLQHVSPIHEFDEDKWDRLIGVMLTGPFLLTKYALPSMRAQKFGRVINMSSIHGLIASDFKSAYVSAKHGIVGFTKVLALEGGPFNITSVAVCPGYVRTPLVENQIQSQAQNYGISEEEVVSKIMLGPAAVKRILNPSEVADLIVYLCGDSAGGITGVAIPIDCGWTAR